MRTETYIKAEGRRLSFSSSVNHDIISSDALKQQLFMGNYSDEDIVASIRKTREQHKEIEFKRPTNFSGRYR